MSTTVIIASTTAGGTGTSSPTEGTRLRVACYGLDEAGEKCEVFVVTPLGNVPYRGWAENGNSLAVVLNVNQPIVDLPGGWDYAFVLSKTNSNAAVYKVN